MKIKLLWAAAFAGFTLPLFAASLAESTFTEIVKEVNVVSGADKAVTPARVESLFKAPDLVRTGADSRAELTAPDQTITRVGASTVFSFEPIGRNLRLEKGSVLFHSPAGKGGGTIKAGGASAAVLGTTIVVVATAEGGFKFIVLEGKGKATLPNGKSATLKAGQLVFVLPGDKGFSPVLDINLGKLVVGSQLVGGFSHELPSLALIKAAIEKQNGDLAKGRATDTGISADQIVAARGFGTGLDTLDHNSYGSAVHPPLTPKQILQVGGGGPASGGRGGPGGANIVPVAAGQ
jgi:hypothetical protein